MLPKIVVGHSVWSFFSCLSPSSPVLPVISLWLGQSRAFTWMNLAVVKDGTLEWGWQVVAVDLFLLWEFCGSFRGFLLLLQLPWSGMIDLHSWWPLMTLSSLWGKDIFFTYTLFSSRGGFFSWGLWAPLYSSIGPRRLPHCSSSCPTVVLISPWSGVRPSSCSRTLLAPPLRHLPLESRVRVRYHSQATWPSSGLSEGLHSLCLSITGSTSKLSKKLPWSLHL